MLPSTVQTSERNPNKAARDSHTYHPWLTKQQRPSLNSVSSKSRVCCCACRSRHPVQHCENGRINDAYGARASFWALPLFPLYSLSLLCTGMLSSPNLSGLWSVSMTRNYSSQRIVPRTSQADPSLLNKQTGHEPGGPLALWVGSEEAMPQSGSRAVQPPRYHHQSRQLPRSMGQKKVAPILQGYFNRSSPPVGRDCDPVRSH